MCRFWKKYRQLNFNSKWDLYCAWNNCCIWMPMLMLMSMPRCWWRDFEMGNENCYTTRFFSLIQNYMRRWNYSRQWRSQKFPSGKTVILLKPCARTHCEIFLSVFRKYRSSHPEVFCKKSVLKNFAKFTGKQLCQSLFFNKVAGQACNFVKKETLVQVFSCEFCEIFRNTFFYRTPLAVASGNTNLTSHASLILLF